MREGQTFVVPVGDLPNKHIPDHPDAYLNALLDYTKGFYSATREAGLPAKVCADAMQHVESAARGLHRKAMLSAAPQSPAQGQVTREEVARAAGEAVGVTWTDHRVNYRTVGSDDDGPTEQFYRIADAVLALFSRQPADTGEGWRPIETAPRDESHFEARCGDCAPCDAYFNGTVFVHHDDDDGEIAYPFTEWRPHQEWRCPDCGAAADERHSCCKAFSEASEARSLIQSDEGR